MLGLGLVNFWWSFGNRACFTIVFSFGRFGQGYHDCHQSYNTGLVTSKLGVFASIDRTVSQGFWLRDHAIFTSIYLNLRVVASISRSLQSRLNKRGSVALVSQIELNKREADSQYDTHVWILFNYEYFFIIMTHNIEKKTFYMWNIYLSHRYDSSEWCIKNGYSV